jgi:hypothetical protein
MCLIARDVQSHCDWWGPRVQSHEVLMPRKTKRVVIVRKQVVSRPKTANKPKSKRRPPGGSPRKKLSAATAAGLAFQKCTLAPADFQDTGFMGIPDEFDGNVVSKKHTLVGSLPSYTAGNDLYIVQMPIPGVAYFWGQRAAGVTTAITLTPIFYDDSSTLFPAVTDTNLTSFRHASNVIEFIPTVNAMNWNGAIEVWKSKVNLACQPGTATTAGNAEIWYLEGLSTALNTQKAQSVFALKDGAYCPAFNTEAAYNWTPIEVDVSYTTLSTWQSQSQGIDNVITFPSATPYFAGCGTFETTVIKFPAIAASQTGIIRAWACVEYQVAPSSILYDYTHMSPAHDPMALAMVKAFHKTTPCAVPWKDNASFWETFKKVVGIGAEALSYLPGPFGLIGKGMSIFFPSKKLKKGGGLY